MRKASICHERGAQVAKLAISENLILSSPFTRRWRPYHKVWVVAFYDCFSEIEKEEERRRINACEWPHSLTLGGRIGETRGEKALIDLKHQCVKRVQLYALSFFCLICCQSENTHFYTNHTKKRLFLINRHAADKKAGGRWINRSFGPKQPQHNTYRALTNNATANRRRQWLTLLLLRAA